MRSKTFLRAFRLLKALKKFLPTSLNFSDVNGCLGSPDSSADNLGDLIIKAYKMQLFKEITTGDKKQRKHLCVDDQEKLEEDEFDNRIADGDEATFHTNVKVTVNRKRKKLKHTITKAL